MASQTVTLDAVLYASEQLSLVDQLRLISLLSERLRSEMDQDDGPVDSLTR